MFYSIQGMPVYMGSAFTHPETGTKYPATWLTFSTADERAAIGIVETEENSQIPDGDTVPQSVSMRQARLALLGAGVLSQVDAAINAMPEPQKTAAKITWEYSAEVQRHNGLVSQMAPALGLTEAKIDALFIAAAQL